MNVVKWLEPCSAAGIGFALNLSVSAAAYAGVIDARSVDPQWVALAGAAGGLVSALVHIGVTSLGAEPASSEERFRAMVEGAFAIVVGALVAAYLVPITHRFVPDAEPSDLRAVGFGFGMAAWRFAPGVFGALKLLSKPATLVDIAIQWLTAMRPKT